MAKVRINPWVFWPSLYILRWFSRIYFRASCRGMENYPESGPFIIAINHNSILDIPVMALAVDRPVFTMAKDSLFKAPVLSWWLRSMGFFPVIRGFGDAEALDVAREVLKSGGILAMAPEGTRRRQDYGRPPAHAGIARLAHEFRCPIIPVGVRGTRRALPPGGLFPRPHKLRIRVGEPIHLEPVQITPENRERLQKQVDFVMDKVYQLSGESFPDSDLVSN